MKKIFMISSLVLSTAAFSQSYDYSKKFGLGGSLGFNFPIFGNNFNTEADSGESWSLYGRYHFNAADALEAAFTKHEFQDTTKALNVSDLTYIRRFQAMERFTPIAGIGLGVVDINNYDPDDLKLGWKLRAGLEYALNNHLNLGFNVDYQNVTKMLFDDNLPGRNIHVLAARVGLTWYFGGTGAAVAGAGAAGAGAVAATKPDFDSKDGAILNVHFATARVQLNEAYDRDLKELAQYMEEHPDAKVEIQGHTDNTGSTAMNQNLSEQRAEEVKDYLSDELDVDDSRIETVGYGEERPISDNSTAEGRLQNRRVIAIIKQ